MKPKALIGQREARNRILTDDELRAVWNAAKEMAYPWGPVFRLLILTGQREREIADMSWPEVDFDKQLLTIAAERMKGRRAHELPLTPIAIELLGGLPRWSGSFVFTTTAGATSIAGFAKAKALVLPSPVSSLARGTAISTRPNDRSNVVLGTARRGSDHNAQSRRVANPQPEAC